MTIYCILFLFFAIFALSFRRVRCYVVPGGEYLSHDRTRIYNAFGITLIMLGHACQHVSDIRACNESFLWLYVSIFRILTVGAFFFFSGYGIMESIQKKGKEYISKLICKRFPHVLFLLVVLVWTPELIKLTIYSMPIEKIGSLLSMTLGFRVGGPWFIQITLLLYLLIYLIFTFFPTANWKRSAIAMLGTTLIVCFILSFRRPFYWLDTILCFPMGVAFSVWRERFEWILKKIRIPHFILGFLLFIFGALGSINIWDISDIVVGFFSLSGIWIDFIRNLMGNIIVLPMIIGGVLCLGCIELREANRFLLWLGGGAVIYLYCLHFIPIRGIQQNSHILPEYAPAIIIINSVLLAYIAQSSMNCLKKSLFHKNT